MFRTVPISFVALVSALSFSAQARAEPEAGAEAPAPSEQGSWFEETQAEPSSESPSATKEDASKSTPKATAPAQAKPASSSPAPAINVVSDPAGDHPADAEPKTRGARRHDGFYLRLSLGGGSLGARGYRYDALDQRHAYEFEGNALTTEIMIGGTPAPGVTLGGAYLGNYAARRDPDAAGQPDSWMSLGIVGPFIDVFPNPRRGFHFGGAIGPAGTASYDDNSEERAVAFGFGGSLWAGYDFWVSDQWSIGAELRLSAARVETPAARNLDFRERDQLGVGSGALLISALYH